MNQPKVSRGFKDLSMTFKASPLNYDLIAIKNETAISRSIRNLVLTNKGERFFNYNLGSRISSLLFEQVDEFTSDLISEEIKEVIKNNEPRVSLNSVTVNPNYDEGSFDVIINYNIIGIDVGTQKLSFALIPTR